MKASELTTVIIDARVALLKLDCLARTAPEHWQLQDAIKYGRNFESMLLSAEAEAWQREALARRQQEEQGG